MIVCTAIDCQLDLVTKFVDSQLPDKDQDLTAKRSEPIKSCIYIYIYKTGELGKGTPSYARLLLHPRTGDKAKLLGVRRGPEMILSHMAPSCLDMSSYRALWTHFRQTIICVCGSFPSTNPRFFLSYRFLCLGTLINC